MPLVRLLLRVALLVCLAHDALADVVLPAVVDDVEISGLWRTEPFVVTRELPWKKGESVTQEAWNLGITRLWNMGVFSEVEAKLEQRDGRTVAVIALEERWTIILMTRGGAGGGSYWLRTGLYDINTLGRFIESGVLYERFDHFNGGQAWLRLPRLFDERQELLLVVDRLARPRLDYTVMRMGAHAEFLRQSNERFSWGVRADAISDDYLPDRRHHDGPPPDRRPRERTLLAGATVRFGRVDTLRLQTTGWSFELRPSMGLTDAPGPFALAQLRAELLAFRTWGPRWTFGLRAQAAASTPAPEAQRFHIGGLDLVRGYRDNFLRTTLYGLANLEARYVLWEWRTWLALMPAAFVDLAAGRGEADGAVGMLSIGAGLRILIPRMVRTGMRVDVAWPVAHERHPGLSVGVYQFF